MDPNNRWLGLYEGTVVKNNDPLQLGRVTMTIPAVVEPESGWVLPIGSAGGGGRRRGMLFVPKPGDSIAVFFHGGNPDQPRYMPGHWGLPGNVRETPGVVGGYTPDGEAAPVVTPEEAPLIPALETDRWIVIFDDRPTKERLLIQDKTTGDLFEFDGVKKGLRIKATSLLDLECEGMVSIRALQLILNGRRVRTTGGDI